MKFDACFKQIQEAAQRELTYLADGEPDLDSEFYLIQLPSYIAQIQTFESSFKVRFVQKEKVGVRNMICQRSDIMELSSYVVLFCPAVFGHCNPAPIKTDRAVRIQ